MGEPSSQNRSCRACQRALDHAGAALMELPELGGGLQRTWSRHAEGEPGDGLHVGHYSFSCRRGVYLLNAEVGGLLQVAESLAGRFAGPAMAGRNRHAEKSNVKPFGR